MRDSSRRRFDAAAIEEIQRRWRHGQTQREIGRAFDRASAVVGRVIARTGGFTPPQRGRSSRVVSLREREEISQRKLC